MNRKYPELLMGKKTPAVQSQLVILLIQQSAKAKKYLQLIM
jgi:hypothetical protein